MSDGSERVVDGDTFVRPGSSSHLVGFFWLARVLRKGLGYSTIVGGAGGEDIRI
jgi:hypothetical protein